MTILRCIGLGNGNRREERFSISSNSAKSFVRLALRCSIALVWLAAFCLPAVAVGQQDDVSPVKTSDWTLLICAYGWLADVSGSVVTDGNELDLDVPFKDILKNANGGFECYLEAGWRDWYAAFDGTWATLGGDVETKTVDFGVEVDQQLYDIRAGYHFYRRDLTEAPKAGEKAWRQVAAVGGYIGARYWGTTITVTDTLFTGKSDSNTVESNRWDPFIGVDGSWDFARRWNLSGRGDIGGFAIGNAAQFAWRLNAEVGFRFLHYLTLGLGYRAMNYNTIEGEGAERNGEDLTEHGPVIAFALRF